MPLEQASPKADQACLPVCHPAPASPRHSAVPPSAGRGAAAPRAGACAEPQRRGVGGGDERAQRAGAALQVRERGRVLALGAGADAGRRPLGHGTGGLGVLELGRLGWGSLFRLPEEQRAGSCRRRMRQPRPVCVHIPTLLQPSRPLCAGRWVEQTLWPLLSGPCAGGCNKLPAPSFLYFSTPAVSCRFLSGRAGGVRCCLYAGVISL